MSCKLYLWGVTASVWTTLYQVAAGSQLQTMTFYLFHIKHLSSLNSHPMHTSCPQTLGVSLRQCWAPVPNQCFSAGNTGTQTHPWLRTEPDSEPTHHFVFKGSFKLQPSVAGAPVVNDNDNIAQRGQGVQSEVLDSFKPVVHQLYLEYKSSTESRGHLLIQFQILFIFTFL